MKKLLILIIVLIVAYFALERYYPEYRTILGISFSFSGGTVEELGLFQKLQKTVDDIISTFKFIRQN